MAAAHDVSKSTVNRLWRLHNIKPHLSRTFKLSRDAKFLEKLTDVVGLYLNPPDRALVLCLDEKSQIQALDRTQPGLPLKKGRCGTMTHDYKRNGTTTLFAALNVLDGKVIGRSFPGTPAEITRCPPWFRNRYRRRDRPGCMPFLDARRTIVGRLVGNWRRTPRHRRLDSLVLPWGQRRCRARRSGGMLAGTILQAFGSRQDLHSLPTTKQPRSKQQPGAGERVLLKNSLRL